MNHCDGLAKQDTGILTRTCCNLLSSSGTCASSTCSIKSKIESCQSSVWIQIEFVIFPIKNDCAMRLQRALEAVGELESVDAPWPHGNNVQVPREFVICHGETACLETCLDLGSRRYGLFVERELYLDINPRKPLHKHEFSSSILSFLRWGRKCFPDALLRPGSIKVPVVVVIVASIKVPVSG